MHDGMPYDPIQGQGQGHECLKATQEESTVSPTPDKFLLLLLLLTLFLTYDVLKSTLQVYKNNTHTN